MRDYLCIEFYYDYIGDKRIITGADLFNAGEHIRSFNKDDIKYIRSEMKTFDIKMKSNRGYNYLDDQHFINHIIRRLEPKKKQYYINKKMVGLVVGVSLATLISANMIANHNKKANINNSVVEAATMDDNELAIDDNELAIDDNEIEPVSNNESPIIATNTDSKEEEFNIESTETIPLLFEETKEDNRIMDNGFENIFEFAYEDRSNNENTSIVNNNYLNYIDTPSIKYGIDPKLMFAIICQENPTNKKNYSMVAGHGVPQIEGIFNNYEITAYNFETNQNESSGPIDVLRCVDDQEYSIKTACMIMNYQYNYIHEQYGYKLTKEQELVASVWSYNKGITIIDEALRNTNSFDDFKNYVLMNSIGGDNEYVEHVFSYIPDQEIITMKTRDGLLNSVMIDNTTVENRKKTTL